MSILDTTPAAAKITTTTPVDLPELCEFLRQGFHEPQDAACFSVPVMAWKYFDPIDGDTRPRSYIARAGDRIVGHIGGCWRLLHRSGGPEVSTVHIIDWLGSPSHPGVGRRLFMHATTSVDTQYAVGGTDAAHKVTKSLNVEVVGRCHLFRRVLRPGYRLRTGSGSTGRRLAGFCNDASRIALRSLRPGVPRLEAVRVEQFGDVDALLESYNARACFTSRPASVLNHYLRHPAGTFSGWMLHDAGRTVGLGMLNVDTIDGVSDGRIIDCIIADDSPRLWTAAIATMTQALSELQVDFVTCLSSVPWMDEALVSNGFAPRSERLLRLRDRNHVLADVQHYHATYLEADLPYR